MRPDIDVTRFARDLTHASLPAAGQTKLSATPFVWRDPATLPRREWLYARHLIRGHVSAKVAAGGVGKSSLDIVEALAMATGRDLLGTDAVHGPLRVWLFNLEDPRDELDRRIAAACLHYGIDPDAIGDRLFVDTGREQPLCIANDTGSGVQIASPVVEALVAEMTRHKVDVLKVDPFVSSHAVNENDNSAIDAVTKTWAAIAGRCNAAVELTHHVRKQAAGTELGADSARGAKALVDASRNCRVLIRMTSEEAERAGVDNHRRYVRIVDDKQNLAPPADQSSWFRLESVALPNGDDVGVVVPWSWPDAFDDVTTADLLAVQRAVAGKNLRQNVQARDWVGNVIAETLKLDLGDRSVKTKIKTLVKAWIDNGAFIVVDGRDDKGRQRPVIEVGEWADA